MTKTKVEKIMNTPVFTINENKLVKEAIKEMEKKKVKKILVVNDENEPIGVLQEWEITKSQMDKQIKSVLLRKFISKPEGTDINVIKQLLRDNTAVYIVDKKNPKKLVGVVTSFDLYKAYIE